MTLSANTHEASDRLEHALVRLSDAMHGRMARLKENVTRQVRAEQDAIWHEKLTEYERDLEALRQDMKDGAEIIAREKQKADEIGDELNRVHKDYAAQQAQYEAEIQRLKKQISHHIVGQGGRSHAMDDGVKSEINQRLDKAIATIDALIDEEPAA